MKRDSLCRMNMEISVVWIYTVSRQNLTVNIYLSYVSHVLPLLKRPLGTFMKTHKLFEGKTIKCTFLVD